MKIIVKILVIGVILFALNFILLMSPVSPIKKITKEKGISLNLFDTLGNQIVGALGGETAPSTEAVEDAPKVEFSKFIPRKKQYLKMCRRRVNSLKGKIKKVKLTIKDGLYKTILFWENPEISVDKGDLIGQLNAPIDGYIVETIGNSKFIITNNGTCGWVSSDIEIIK